MFKKLTLLLILGSLLLTNQPTKTPTPAAGEIQPTQKMEVEVKVLDPRAVILRDYLARYNSPLQDNAQDFIDASDQYGVDWKLVPAISGVESTFGQNSAGGYNDWGWGVYGNQAIYFKSQREAIFTVTAGLKQNYIDKGMIDPYQINYVYAASPFWGGKVAYFMEDLDKFSQNYNQPAKLTVDKTLTNQSDTSAQLALR